jgi:hypothetical protein
LRSRGRIRNRPERQPHEQRRDDQAEQADRPEQARRADAARLDGCHLAFVVQAAEPQHDRQVEADGHDDREIGGRGQGDQREHDLAREIVGGRLGQHPRQLIGQQDHQQHERHRDAGHGDFAKDVPVQRAHRCGRLRHFREESSWNFS